MSLDFRVVRSTNIATLIYFVEAVVYLSSTVKRVRARSAKYPILSTIYYLLLGYAVLNSYLAELPSNTDRSNGWALPRTKVVLTALDYTRLLIIEDVTELLSYDAVLLFVQEK